ncbi:ribosome small subunit-dependent GTPase A [Sedimentibacter sp. zth1]|uniref:ribosome small subunit-dependent GTPase A n=1 Tax=Sedimentibacter sp. zth1 TaxID=2816908 RepID=UPI001A926CC3|nr:ribosome small subunit-dependent GTPase A [Sedimentibacter sp. zth1]QSX05482.1 ribosome small subunit-dependent GTPase A [Sedimentibacter sp. zth1]
MNKDLIDYGYTEFFKNQVDDIDNNKFSVARIIEVQKERYTIKTENEIKGARLKGSEFFNFNNTTYPTVGDFVLVLDNKTGDNLIYKVLNRKSKFSRIDFHYSKEQIVAANFDYVFIVSSLNNDLNIKRLERYVTVTFNSGATPVIVLTKADMCENYLECKSKVEDYFIGTDVFCVSSYTGLGFDKLQKYIESQKTIVLLGSSGVGKSSLINYLAKDLIMKVNDIREDDDKGRHTTTHRELIMLESGTMIIDTPGMRELGMWTVDEGLQEEFSEIEELVTRCKFNNCTHTNEPGCAILNAIKNGSLTEEKYKTYLKLQKESKFARIKELRKQSALEKKRQNKINKKNKFSDYKIR